MQLEFEIPLLVVLIGLSGFFSGLEVALVGVRMAKVEQMVKDKVKGSTSLLKLKKNPSRMMASVNLGNNLVNVASTAIATDIALKIFGNDGLAIVIGIMTFLILVFGEITPKHIVMQMLQKLLPDIVEYYWHLVMHFIQLLECWKQ